MKLETWLKKYPYGISQEDMQKNTEDFWTLRGYNFKTKTWDMTINLDYWIDNK